MKNTKKYLLISLALLFLLVAGFGILYLTEPEVEAYEEEVEEYSYESNYLIEKEYGDIDYVEISGPNGDYVIRQETETIEPDEDDEDGETTYSYSYYFEGYEDYDVTSSLSSAVQSLVKLSINKEIGSVDDLSQYGLDGDETTTITMNYDDGTTDVMSVGLEGASTYGYYVYYGGEVNIAYINSIVLNDITDNVNSYSYTASALYDDTGTLLTSVLNYITFSGTNFEVPIEVYYNADSWSNYSMSSPVSSDCGSTNTEALVTLLESFTVDDVVAVGVTEETLSDYGLDEPFATIEFDINGTEHTISVSEQVGSNRYVIADGVTNVVYTVAATTVSAWAETDATTLRDTFVFLPYIADVDEFTVTTPDLTVTIDLERTIDEENSTEDVTSYDYTAYYLGSEITYSDNVTSYYKELISLPLITVDELEHEDTASLTLSYTYYAGGTDVVEYYKAIDEDRYVAYLNGEYSATIRSSNIDSFYTTTTEFDAANK